MYGVFSIAMAPSQFSLDGINQTTFRICKNSIFLFTYPQRCGTLARLAHRSVSRFQLEIYFKSTCTGTTLPTNQIPYCNTDSYAIEGTEKYV